MLSMPPADSVIGSLPSRHDSAPGDAGWLSSGGPVLTPDSIDSVFDGCDAFSYEDRPATGVYCASGFSSKVIPRLDGTKKRDRRSLHPYGNPVRQCQGYEVLSQIQAIQQTIGRFADFLWPAGEPENVRY